MIKKLVVKEIELDREEVRTYPAGHKYAYFQDPETGDYYEPLSSFEVAGDNLESMFRKVNS